MECSMEKECKNLEENCILKTCLYFSTIKLSREFNKIGEEAFKKIRLSPSHAMLIYVVNQTDTIQQKELGERLFLTPSTITRFIEKLVYKELIVKHSEGKNVYVSTTPKGKALQSEIIEIWKTVHNIYDDILTEEETKQFIALSNKLIGKLGQ